MGYVLNDGVTLVKCPVYDESAVYLSRSYSFKRAMYIYMHSNVTWVGREDIVDSAGINLNFPPFYDILLVSTFRIVSCIQRAILVQSAFSVLVFAVCYIVSGVQ